MINLNFKYNQNKVIVQCNANDNMRDICQKFASKINVDVDSKIYIFNNTKLNINSELNLTFAEQVNSDDIINKEIQVFDNKDNEYTIKFTYKGENKEIKVKDTETVGSLTDIIGKYIKKKKTSFYSLYNGKAIVKDDMDKPINQITKLIDKSDKKMDLVIEDGLEEEEEEEKEEEVKRKHSVKNTIRNTSIQDDENEEDNDSEGLIYRTSKEAGTFLIKIHLVLFIQFFMIGLFIWLGFLFNFEEKFVDKNRIWSLILITLFSFFLTSFTLCYNSVHKKWLSFNIFLYIPVITLYIFLLSKYTKKDYFLIQISLFISDFLGIIIFILIVRRYKGFGVLIFTLIFNASLMITFYYKEIFDIKEKKAIIIISILSFIFIAYITIFNDIARQKFEDNEIRGAVFHFNYNIFYPALTFFIIIVISAFIIIICGIISAICIIVTVFLLITMFFKSLR